MCQRVTNLALEPLLTLNFSGEQFGLLLFFALNFLMGYLGFQFYLCLFSRVDTPVSSG